jgi:predicted acylesterase/phospholipase RssA
MFDKVVFAGGGHRCWWQAGFWDTVSGEIELHPRVIGAVSAGAVTACLLHANDSKRALAWYERELAHVRSNVNWLNLMRRGERLMPHAAIYRKALRALLGGDHFRQLMWRAPEIRVLIARLPPGMSAGRAALRGLLAYNIEKYRHGSLHAGIGERLGFTHEIRRVQDCRGERELVDLLMASSCTPPFTPLELLDGEPCLDGGLMDNVPVATVADVPGQTLVLATRRYKRMAPVFARDGRVYVQPSQRLAAASWDYTAPASYLKTYDQGRRDGDAFLRMFALGRFEGTGLRDEAPATPRVAIVADPLPQTPAAQSSAPETGTRGTATAETSTAEISAAEASAPDGAGARAETTPAGDRAAEEEPSRALDVSVKLTAYRGPMAAGTADDLNASQPPASDGQLRSGRSLRASNI